MGKRPSFGRSKSERGLDQFDTPPIALGPLFEHEPLLAGVTSICEPFCGKGNLVIAMRARGLTVHASDISDRGCPDSTVLDFLAMTQKPCDVLLSNCPYARAMDFIEHALNVLKFRIVILLLSPSFLFSLRCFYWPAVSPRSRARSQQHSRKPICHRLFCRVTKPPWTSWCR
jgi:hypothetical protein